MKYVVAAFIVASIAISSNDVAEFYLQGNSETGNVIYSDAFNEGTMSYHAPYACSTYYAADDFVPPSDCCITDVSFWFFSTRPPLASASELDVSFYASGTEGPGDLLWLGQPASISYTNTGVKFASFYIFQLACELPESGYVNLTAGQTYWAAIGRTAGGDMYTIMNTVVTGSESWGKQSSGDWYTGSSLGYAPVNMFMEIEDNSTSAFQNLTWGAIKAGY
jgi:hypothetical protein